MKKICVFLFEDEALLNQKLSIALEKEGFEVASALSYDEAQLLIQQFSMTGQPALALLDIKQSLRTGIPPEIEPDKAGFFIARSLRETFKDIPIIFLTAYPEIYKEDAEVYQPFAFMSKGHSQEIFSEELKKQIDQALEGRRTENWSNLPKGKICLKAKVKLGGKHQEEQVVQVYDLDDILYFEGQGGQLTRVFMQSSNRVHTMTLTPAAFFEKIGRIIQEHRWDNPFVEVFRGKYARFDKIVSYSRSSVYFNYECTIGVQINSATYLKLQEMFPAVLMY